MGRSCCCSKLSRQRRRERMCTDRQTTVARDEVAHSTTFPTSGTELRGIDLPRPSVCSDVHHYAHTHASVHQLVYSVSSYSTAAAACHRRLQHHHLLLLPLAQSLSLLLLSAPLRLLPVRWHLDAMNARLRLRRRAVSRLVPRRRHRRTTIARRRAGRA